MSQHEQQISRREVLGRIALGSLTTGLVSGLPAVAKEPVAKKNDQFKLNYILNSAMYGYTDVKTVIEEVHKTGTSYIDIWPKVHGNQREQAAAMGDAAFKNLLVENQVKLGVVTCYKQGPFKLASEMKFAHEVAGEGTVLVTGARGPKNLKGAELKKGVRKFVEQMKPHVELAEKYGCSIAVENHANSLISSPDSMRWFSEMAQSARLGIAFAPHHLPQDSEFVGQLADEVGAKILFFYAQQHGHGSSKKLPKAEEMLQMPGLGPLDFTPSLAALKKHNYQGFTEVFMHPVPRGVPILETTSKITDAIIKSQRYLDKCLEST